MRVLEDDHKTFVVKDFQSLLNQIILRLNC